MEIRRRISKRVLVLEFSLIPAVGGSDADASRSEVKSYQFVPLASGGQIEVSLPSH